MRRSLERGGQYVRAAQSLRGSREVKRVCLTSALFQGHIYAGSCTTCKLFQATCVLSGGEEGRKLQGQSG